jgi:hypothetical protein
MRNSIVASRAAAAKNPKGHEAEYKSIITGLGLPGGSKACALRARRERYY